MAKIAIKNIIGSDQYQRSAFELKFLSLIAYMKEEGHMDFRNVFASNANLTDREKDELALTFGLLKAFLPYNRQPNLRDAIFNILCEERRQKESTPLHRLKVTSEGVLEEGELDHRIPLTSRDAFRKYLKRAEDKPLDKFLVNAKRGKLLENRTLWTDLTVALVILFSIYKPTHASSKEIHEDLLNLVDLHPELKEKGVNTPKPSTIRHFIKNKGKALISFAKDNPNDFKRKHLGCLRFIPPSAPLIQVGVDGYHFQLLCEDDDSGKAIQLIAIVIYDFKTKCVLGLAIGKSENNLLFRKAFADFFKTVGNQLPRQIVMDKFSAYTCERTRNLNKLFKDNGVKITRSSQPNNNGRLERFFGVIQNFYQGAVLAGSYIGSGITSKTTNARPSRKVQMLIRRKEFLKGESEMTHLCTYLLKEEYNKKFKALGDKSPMELFQGQKSNPIGIVSENDVAYGTLDGYRCTIIGCGIMIKSGDYLHLFKERTFEIASNYFKKKVDAYVDLNCQDGNATIFHRGTRKFMINMLGVAVVPCSIFDRTDEHNEFIRQYNKETRSLIQEFKKCITDMQCLVDSKLDGIDIRESSLAGKIKKNADAAFTQAQVGLIQPKPEPNPILTNAIQSKRNGRLKKTPEQILIEKYQLIS